MTQDPAIVQECFARAVVYTGESDAVWTASPGVVLDARFLFRGILLDRSLRLEGLTIAQVCSSGHRARAAMHRARTLLAPARHCEILPYDIPPEFTG
jgi:hypothetical protein